MSAAEEWRPIPGHNGYGASSSGRIRSRRKVLKPWRSNEVGHLKVGLGNPQKRMWVHRAVLLAFVGPCPEGLEVRHLNGDPTDNRLENLRYGTRSENMLDMVAHGTIYRGGSVGRGHETICRRGHQKDPGPCSVCRLIAKRAWVDKNVGIYADCEDCGKRVSVLNMTRHKRTTCSRSAAA